MANTRRGQNLNANRLALNFYPVLVIYVELFEDWWLWLTLVVLDDLFPVPRKICSFGKSSLANDSSIVYSQGGAVNPGYFPPSLQLNYGQMLFFSENTVLKQNDTRQRSDWI